MVKIKLLSRVNGIVLLLAILFVLVAGAILISDGLIVKYHTTGLQGGFAGGNGYTARFILTEGSSSIAQGNNYTAKIGFFSTPTTTTSTTSSSTTTTIPTNQTTTTTTISTSTTTTTISITTTTSSITITTTTTTTSTTTSSTTITVTTTTLGSTSTTIPATTSTSTTTTTTIPINLTIQPSVSVTRILPPTAQPNSNLIVSLNLVILNESSKPSGVIIKEYVPKQWNLTSSNPNRDDFDSETGEIRWLLFGDTFYTRNLTYTISVPSNATGMVEFSGVMLYTLEGNQVTRNITGSNTIQIGYTADTDNDGMISDFELLNYINLWVQELVDDFSLLEAIDAWAKGG